MPRYRHPALLTAGALLALTLGGCTSVPPATTPVHMQADYPIYDEHSLVDEAGLIAEGTILAAESTVLTARYEGDTPESNPLVGLSEAEKARALQEDNGVPATAVTMLVDVTHHGPAKPGQKITIMQTGGSVNGVEYRIEAEAPLVVGQTYLLFTRESFDGAYIILGGSAGTYISDGKGAFTAVNPNAAPFRILRADDLDRLVN